MSPGLLAGLVMVIAVISRPIDVRLWRRGRLSDRTAAVLLLGRLPIVLVLFGLIQGMSLLLVLVLVIPAVLVARLFYPFIRTLMEDQRREWQRRTVVTAVSVEPPPEG